MNTAWANSGRKTSSAGDPHVLRLLILVEGETEETFVNEVLGPYLFSRGFSRVDAKIMGNARLRSKRGGVRGWPEVRSEILRHLRSDDHIYVTTLVDYYGMPGDQRRAQSWPGRQEAAVLPFWEKGNHVESALVVEIDRELRDTRRFIPFVVMHEFEAVLFSDCEKFATAIGRSDLRAELNGVSRFWDELQRFRGIRPRGSAGASPSRN